MKRKISPSLMCLGIEETVQAIHIMDSTVVDYFHLDVMDGVFVPNLMLGTAYIRQIKRLTKTPLDLHLMITNPEQKIEWFEIEPGDRVSFHIESTVQINRTIQKIREKQAYPVITLNPETSIHALDYVLGDVEGVLLMTVNPGYAGQSLIDGIMEKIRELREYLDKKGFCNISIGVDGNVSYENAKIMSELGADYFVSGTSSIFKGADFETCLPGNIRKLRNAIMH